MKNKNINSTFLENEVIISPKEYDKYLKVLAFHAFLFSVLISFYFFKIVV